MADDLSGTKLALIEAGGELFAEFGLGGAGTRAIAERAGANLAAVNYHFGGKENLYLEALRHAVSHKSASWTERIQRVRAAYEAGADLHQSLSVEIRRHLADFFGQELPRWRLKLLVRTLMEPSPSLQALSQELFVPDFEVLCVFARSANPTLSEEQAKLWANTLFAQVLFVSLSQVLTLDYEGWEAYPKEHLDRVADHTALLLVAALWPDRVSTPPKETAQ